MTLLNSGTENLYGIRSNVIRNTISAVIIIVMALKLWMFVIDNIVSVNVPYRMGEFMVNFQGGFVRCGALGELLYRLCVNTGLTGWQLYYWIVCPVCILLYTGVVWFFVHMFRKRYMCWWLVFSVFFCGYINDIVRKDYLLYLILISVVWIASGQASKRMRQTAATAVIIVGLFLHEAFIFYGAPLIVIWMFRSACGKGDVLTASALTLVIAGVFGLLCVFRGSPEIAEAVDSSWRPLLPGFPRDGHMGVSVESLGWKLEYTVKMHLVYNFGNYGLFYYPIIFLTAYYLAVNFPIVFRTRPGDFDTRRQTLLSALILTSTFFMLPMLTILSCDQSRNMQYIFVTSFAYLLLMPVGRLETIFPSSLLSWIERFNHRLNTMLPPSKGWLLCLFFFVGIWFYSCKVYYIIYNSLFYDLINGGIDLILRLKGMIC